MLDSRLVLSISTASFMRDVVDEVGDVDGDVDGEVDDVVVVVEVGLRMAMVVVVEGFFVAAVVVSKMNVVSG